MGWVPWMIMRATMIFGVALLAMARADDAATWIEALDKASGKKCARANADE